MDQSIQAALSRPPVFGDVEQIKALRALRQEEELIEMQKAEGKKQYEVTVECTWKETVVVWAYDSDDAIEQSKERAEGDDPEYEFNVRELKGE